MQPHEALVKQHICACSAGARVCKPEVEEAAWRLVWLARELADDSLAAFAGKLLALAGPLDASVIAFSMPSLEAGASSPVPLPHARQPPARGGGRGAVPEQVQGRPQLPSDADEIVAGRPACACSDLLA